MNIAYRDFRINNEENIVPPVDGNKESLSNEVDVNPKNEITNNVTHNTTTENFITENTISSNTITNNDVSHPSDNNIGILIAWLCLAVFILLTIIILYQYRRL